MARPRGFATWKPKDETLALVADIESVLAEYKEHLPLTARQIFYRLVGQYGFDKTEQAYARLCETLVRARRAGWIPFSSIRDDGTQGGPPQTYSDVEDFWADVRDSLKHYSRDRLTGQEVAVELWCEAAGMVPQLRRVAYRYSVPVYSTGGFSSVTVTHEIAQRALRRKVPTVFLHVGDYDPSGESIFTSMSNDARMFTQQVVHTATTADDPKTAISLGEMMGLSKDEVMKIVEGERKPALRPVRVALTEAQVREHDLPTAPPKKSDTRTRNWVGETCQLEAMPPEVLADTIRDAIRDQLDLNRFEHERGLEAADIKRIEEGLETMKG